MNTYTINKHTVIDYSIVPFEEGYKIEVSVAKRGQVIATFVSPRIFNSYRDAMDARDLLKDRVHGTGDAPISAMKTLLGVRS